MPKILVSMTLDVTDAEQSNLLARLSGVLGNVSNVSVDGAAAADEEGGPVNANAPAVDAKGYPWNAEFHSANKSTNADGTWRYKRGVDKTKLAAWEATARQIGGAPGPAPETFTLPASIAGTSAPVTLPLPPAASAIPGFPGFPAPVAAPIDVPVTMETINGAFAKLNAAGVLAPDGSNIADVYGKIGMTSGDQLATDETIRRKLMDELKARFPGVSLT